MEFWGRVSVVCPAKFGAAPTRHQGALWPKSTEISKICHVEKQAEKKPNPAGESSHGSSLFCRLANPCRRRRFRSLHEQAEAPSAAKRFPFRICRDPSRTFLKFHKQIRIPLNSRFSNDFLPYSFRILISGLREDLPYFPAPLCFEGDGVRRAEHGKAFQLLHNLVPRFLNSGSSRPQPTPPAEESCCSRDPLQTTCLSQGSILLRSNILFSPPEGLRKPLWDLAISLQSQIRPQASKDLNCQKKSKLFGSGQDRGTQIAQTRIIHVPKARLSQWMGRFDGKGVHGD